MTGTEGGLVNLIDNIEVNFILLVGVIYLVYQKYKELRSK